MSEREEDQRANVPDYPWRATVTEGAESHDITRELAVMYDAVIGSMDWGSGFLDIEDVRALFRVASLCGFGGVERGYDLDSGYFALLNDAGELLTPAIRRESVYAAAGRGHMEHRLHLVGERFDLLWANATVTGRATHVAIYNKQCEEIHFGPLPEPIDVTADKGVPSISVPVPEELQS